MTYYDTPHPLVAENAMLKRLLRDLLPLVPASASASQPVATARAVLGLNSALPPIHETHVDRTTRLREQFDQDDCA